MTAGSADIAMTLKIPSDTNIDTIYAKIRARRAAIREKGRLLGLCSLKGLPNLAAEIYPEQGIQSPQQFQKRLTDDHVADLTWIGDFLGEPEHGFFLWLMKRYQVENIKVLFRGFHARLGLSEVIPYLVKMPVIFELPAERMITARDAAAFAETVSDARVRELVEAGVSAYRKKAKPFYFDTVVDREYFTRLLSLADDLSLGPGAKLIALDADIYLAMMAIRLKTTYRIEFDEVAPLLHVPGALPPATLKKVYSAESVTAAVQALPKKFGAALGERFATPEDIERAMITYFHARAEATLITSGITMAVVVAFYYLKRIELANLIRLVEGYRYGLSAAELKRTLVPPAE